MKQGFLGHEVGRADGDAPLGVVNHVVDEAQVVFRLETGAGGHNLGTHPITRIGDIRVNFGEQQLVRLGVPIGDEDGVELFDDGAGAGERKVLPLQTLFDVFGGVVGTIDDVLRAGEGDLSIYDEYLAVVTQVGSLPLELPGLNRQHELPLHAGLVEHLHEVLVGGVLARADVVDQHAYLHSAAVGREEGIPEHGAGFVVGGDVELEVHVFGGPVHGLGHFNHGLVVVGVEGELVTADEGERTEGVVELAGYLGGVGEVVGAGEGRLVFGGFANHIVHGVLPCASVRGQA